MVKRTLAIMAAGMGSRYGGLKQIDPIGPKGEIIMEYSIHDGINAGFNRVVFIIKEENYNLFKETIGDKISKIVEVAYVFQDSKNLPEGRVKPWGTAHAILSCKEVINEPFAVINADDFYGARSFRLIYDFLNTNGDPNTHCMSGFTLDRTLTENGAVARGICEIDENENLLSIVERTEIKKDNHMVVYRDGENWNEIDGKSIASMNIWGFKPSIFKKLEEEFPKFLQRNKGNILKAEFYIPSVVDTLIKNNEGKIKVLKTPEQWYGVTYREDRDFVKNAISRMKAYRLKELVKHFQLEGKFLKGIGHNSGHINDTFVIEVLNLEGRIKRYIFQRINTKIFNNPEKLMENIEKITTHIGKKVEALGGDPLRETLTIVKTLDGKNFYVDEDNEVWRMYHYIEGAKTYMKVEKPEHMYKTGKALGKFQKQLSDFPVEDLYDTLPNFHNTAMRFENFKRALENNRAGRVDLVRDEIQFILSREKDTRVLIDLLEKGKLPLRVTHNDTKFNNIMIDEATDEGIAVIDLDTVMGGLSLYDFGDSMRSGATTALEDEEDLSKVNFSMELFEEYTRGFLETAGDTLNKEELDHLAFSAKVITLEQAIRFLGDYLDGDIYYKISKENHNLIRARNQIKLVKDMEANMESMKDIVNKYR
ncbi:dTDP-glucose pyrophosphorylase [Cetobacterium ceti]|uniref:dTDP-glucose pyrophosphorylase n=1 Tax=Cetobacterium ceti TaxID=180163 RepID=A0A1T4M227_9FUSO|nr:phosphotransferase [Cetobacterium ceti]SJZ60937.1 dTDP-glucose pyrophosphorylase [Cetobacterium ceti]